MACTSPAPASAVLQRRGNELEKFKRRMIRAVASRMQGQKSGDEAWDELKKEVGKNCQNLWEKMKRLTLRKMKRLLEADDRVDQINPVARMNVTDWLLFDLVIVHEQIDVIERDKKGGKYNSKVLENLFSLVQRFELEDRVGENLAEAWTAATVYYNSKGHQCSPMMLQRRWYQIKELTRHKFYRFWFNYRGNQRQLAHAKQDPPDDLQKAIANKYPQIVTEPFITWEEAIQNRTVILTDELGMKMRQKNLMKPSDVTAPDVVLIEPQIEVIDLGANSGSEEETDEVSERNASPLVQIKSEPVDRDDNLQVVETVYQIPEEEVSEFDDEIQRLQLVEERIDDCQSDDNDIIISPNGEFEFPIVEGATGEQTNEAIVIDEVDDHSGTKEHETVYDITENEIINENKLAESDEHSIAEIYSIESAGVKVENINDVIEHKEDTKDQVINDTVAEILPIISTVSSAGIKVETNLAVYNTLPEQDMTVNNDVLPINTSTTITQSYSSTGVSAAITAILKEADMQDEQIDEASSLQNESGSSDVISINNVKNPPPNSIIGLDAFGDVSTTLNFADEGIEFADDGIAYVDDDDEGDLTSITEPSKAIAKQEIDDEEVSQASAADNGTKETDMQKFDLKLLMCPIVYTTKLEAMAVFKDNSQYEQVYDKESIDKIITLNKPVSKKSVNVEQVENDISNGDVLNDTEKNTQSGNIEVDETADVSDDDLFQNGSNSDSEDNIDDNKRVKLTSYMLQKPKNRSYNPILLCKNPDFNTRLKRLPVGFFMSSRNRTLLQCCMPMTIDMTKAFESKLINGTMYLKPTPKDSVINIPDDDIISTSVVKPSAMPVQSLMNIDETLESELKKRMCERMRAINLPDISQVRRVNQHILTAEVTPRLDNEIAEPHANNQNTAILLKSPTKSGPSDYVQNIKNHIDNLISQKNTQESNPEHSETTKIPKADDFKATAKSANTSKKLINIPITSITSGNTRVAHSGPTVPRAKKPSRKTYYPPLSWNKAKFSNDTAIKESLLTIDTLYKMLHALSPTQESPIDIKKPKKKKKYAELSVDTLAEKAVQEKKKTIHVEAEPPLQDSTVNNKVKPQIKKPKCKVNVVRRNDYCCWYGYKLEYLSRHLRPQRKHKCQPLSCKCCCREIWDDLPINVINSSNLAHIDITSQQNLESISETIEHVVQTKPRNTKSMSDAGVQIDLDGKEPTDVITNRLVNHASVVPDKATQMAVASIELAHVPEVEIPIMQPLVSKSSPQTNASFRVYTGDGKPSNTIKDSFPIKPNVKTYKPRRYPSRSSRQIQPELPPSNVSRSMLQNLTPQDSVKCTCHANITAVSQGKIEINGRNACPQHVKIRKENTVFTKRLVNDVNQPFYVGKGKILLTNKKMPKKEEEPPVLPVTDIGQVPVLSLPAGINIMLMENGTVTYVKSNDAKLTPEEYATLPHILIALQQELGAVGITLPEDHPVPNSDEIIDLDKDDSKPETSSEVSISTAPIHIDTSEPKTIELATGGIVMKKCSTSEIYNENNWTKDPMSATEDTEITTENVSSKKPKPDVSSDNFELNTAKINEINETPLSNTEQTPVNNEPGPDAANRKSLLSDLMEMSGIFEEDVAAPLSVEINLTPSTPTLEILPTIPVPGLSPLTTSKKTPPDDSYELSPVTSFAELKYASENNGQFFKLDLTTGKLTSINVCIQRYPTSLPGQPMRPVTVDEAVIDLTDDPDNIQITQVDTTPEVSPEKATEAKKLQSSVSVLKKRRFIDRLINNLKPVNIQKSSKHVARILKRSKSLLQNRKVGFYTKPLIADVHIDLVDSDTPMEEEYLVNVSDSSDDEPLVKKAFRKRAEELTEIIKKQAKFGRDDQVKQTDTENVTTSGVQENLGHEKDKTGKCNTQGQVARPHSDEVGNENEDASYDQQDIEDLDETVDMSEPIPTAFDEPMPVPTNLLLSGNHSMHNIPLNQQYVEEDEDNIDSQDDCILGV